MNLHLPTLFQILRALNFWPIFCNQTVSGMLRQIHKLCTYDLYVLAAASSAFPCFNQTLLLVINFIGYWRVVLLGQVDCVIAFN